MNNNRFLNFLPYNIGLCLSSVIIAIFLSTASSAQTRDISGRAELDVKRITVKVGAKRPFELMHNSDSHLVFADVRDPEKKSLLARFRHSEFPWALYCLQKELEYASKNNLPILHTGDMIDFVSEMNLDQAVSVFSIGDWFLVASGNHEFSQFMSYFGPEQETDEYKAQTYDKVQTAYPDDFSVCAKVKNGVNFIALDNSYYKINQAQFDKVKAEFAKGLPVVLAVHVPFYTPELYNRSSDGGKKFSYLCCPPSEDNDALTLEFIEWLKQQPQLKAIFSGHLHFFWEEEFAPGVMQYTVGAGSFGQAYHIRFVR